VEVLALALQRHQRLVLGGGLRVFLAQLLVGARGGLRILLERSERSIRRDWQKARMFLLASLKDS
jgi:hypothetical protein